MSKTKTKVFFLFFFFLRKESLLDAHKRKYKIYFEYLQEHEEMLIQILSINIRSNLFLKEVKNQFPVTLFFFWKIKNKRYLSNRDLVQLKVYWAFLFNWD